MKFEKDKVLIGNNVDETKKIEGGIDWLFIQRALADLNVDSEKLNILEIGPKHGFHTMCLDSYNPKSITCVESPTKFRDREVFYNYNARWMPNIKCNKFDFHFTDFMNYTSDNKFDVILYTGVFYHNIDQIGHLKKLYSLASDNCYLLFGSSLTRNDEYKDKNIIEVHYPPYSDSFGHVKSIVFHPSNKACKTMLEVSGWEILFDDTKYEDIQHKDNCRVSLVARKKQNTSLDYWSKYTPGKISMDYSS